MSATVQAEGERALLRDAPSGAAVARMTDAEIQRLLFEVHTYLERSASFGRECAEFHEPPACHNSHSATYYRERTAEGVALLRQLHPLVGRLAHQRRICVEGHQL